MTLKEQKRINKTEETVLEGILKEYIFKNKNGADCIFEIFCSFIYLFYFLLIIGELK